MNKNEYLNFIIKHFPNSSISKNPNLEGLYKAVTENNITTNLYIRNLDSCHKTTKTLILRFRDLTYRFLIVCPVNDLFSINFYMRLMTENVLKIIYSLNSEQSLNEIDKMKYRYLKDSLNTFYKNNSYLKSDLNELYNLYGKYSNYVHNKNYILNLESMESIITSSSLDLVIINRNLGKIINAYNKVVIYELKLDNDTLSTPDKLQILHNFRKKISDIFFEFLSHNK